MFGETYILHQISSDERDDTEMSQHHDHAQQNSPLLVAVCQDMLVRNPGFVCTFFLDMSADARHELHRQPVDDDSESPG